MGPDIGEDLTNPRGEGLPVRLNGLVRIQWERKLRRGGGERWSQVFEGLDVLRVWRVSVENVDVNGVNGG